MTGIATLLILISAAIFPGIIAIVKAKMGGRKGPTLFQPLFDILRLLRKGSVYSHSTTGIFRIGPAIYLATVLLASAFIPFEGHRGIFSFTGDFVLFAYILAMGRFIMIVSAMDTGSGFEGMGANREVFYSMLLEPAFFVMFASLALLTDHNSSFAELFTHIYADSNLSFLMVALGLYLLVQIAMVENSRLPVDDPKTHLELTMVHEVMVLDNSGFDLGLIQLTSSLKFAIYGGLMANFLMNEGQNTLQKILVFIGTQILFAIIVGLIESFRARSKMARNAQWIITLSSIAMVVFFTALLYTQKFILN